MSPAAVAETDKLERIAKILASVLYRPAPDMSGNIWKSLGEGPHKRCLKAAEEILNELQC
jgi:hypothetical protein